MRLGGIRPVELCFLLFKNISLLLGTYLDGAAFPVRRRGPSAPNGNHQDHGTKGPCSESRDLPARFRRPDLRPRPPFASGVRVPFAILSCQASETTCDRSFPAMVFL